VSFLGGTAPLGIFGTFSAICLILPQTRFAPPECQTLYIDDSWLVIGDRWSLIDKTSASRANSDPQSLITSRSPPEIPPPLCISAAVSAPAWRALFPRSSYIHRQGPALKLFVVKLLHRFY